MKTTIAMLICCAAMGQEKPIPIYGPELPVGKRFFIVGASEIYLNEPNGVSEASMPMAQSSLIVVGPHGKSLVTFKADGQIVLGKGVNPDDAAKAFLKAVTRAGWSPRGMGCPGWTAAPYKSQSANLSR